MIHGINTARNFMQRIRFFLISIVLLITALYPAAAQDQPLKVVATTTIVADVAKNVGGDLVSVTPLVPPDADAHAFEPAPQDALAVSEADVVLAVGAGYEAFLSGLEENAARTDIVSISDGVTMYPFVLDEDAASSGEVDVNVEPLGVLGTDDICDAHHDEHDEPEATEAAEHEHEHGGCDPHVWTDPTNVMIWADNIAEVFAAKDPDHADTYRANAEAYRAQLAGADEAISQILSTVPDERRVLVTNHEFMSYFARAYGFSLVGVVVPGGTTGGETDPQAVAGLITTVKNAGVPAIFAEASANTQLIDAVASDAGARVVSTLSESLTAAGGVADTYLAYLTYNAQTIADALANP
jgi:ABC-type Zn uptake system ZnuABC Zn-binding protein ZnuA